MEDEKIKELFSNFQPELSPSYKFMNNLQKKMEMMDELQRYSAILRRRNRVAVVVAALSGFVSGVITTLLLPLIVSWFSTLSLPHLQISGMMIDGSILGWIAIAGTSVITALSVYDLAMSRSTIGPEYL